jgi:hypothetical protein
MKITILTLALTCLGQSFKKVSVGDKEMVVYTPPKAGTHHPSSRTSSSDSCGFFGTKMSYPQPGTFGNLIGTRKCFDYCYDNGYETAHCAGDEVYGLYCNCFSYVPTEESLGQSYKKVSTSRGIYAYFTPPKAGSPPSDLRKISSVSERCSDQGFLTSYPQPGPLGDLNGTRKCYDYCYSLSFKGAVCLEHYCKCVNPFPTDELAVSEKLKEYEDGIKRIELKLKELEKFSDVIKLLESKLKEDSDDIKRLQLKF